MSWEKLADWKEALFRAYTDRFTITFPDDTLQRLDNWVGRHVLPWAAVIIYLIAINVLPTVMIKFYKKFPNMRPNTDPKAKMGVLDYVMFLWNVFLSLMSFAILLGCFIPFFKYYVIPQGFVESICNESGDASRAPSTMVFWGMMFIYSKYFELFDTVLIIIRKPERPIKFLHWYHHCTVLLFSWYANQRHMCVGYFSGFQNVIVHTFMYYYYAMAIIGRRPTWGLFLTLGQTFQMFAGLGIFICWTVWYYVQGLNCNIDGNPIVLLICGYIMYASYLYLFVEFLYKRYFQKKKKKDKKKEKKDK